MPKGVSLKQYYHLRQADIEALLNHWMQRQAAGKVPFCFRGAVKAIRKNQYTPEENDADIDMGLAEETEVGLQEDDGNQEQGGGPPQGASNGNGSTKHDHPGQSPGVANKNPNGVSWLLIHDK